MNRALKRRTGRYGTFSERTVHDLLTRTRSPRSRTQLALEEVFDRPIVDLGFTPTARHHQQHPEDPMKRRSFLVTAPIAAAATAGITPSRQGAPYRIGAADVERLELLHDQTIDDDDQAGGTEALERRSAALAEEALAMQQRGSASGRVRSRLYGVAASLTDSAMWAAIDGRRPGAAQAHLHHAVTLASLSGDQVVQIRVWGHAAALYRQMGRFTDSTAAAEAARAVSLCRSDAFYASMTRARLSLHQAHTADRSDVLRSLDQARKDLSRSDAGEHRSRWTQFYDAAEIELLATQAHTEMGRWQDAEAHAHHTLAFLRPSMVRNRALVLAYLAGAQLRQGEIQLAVGTAKTVPAVAVHGRVEHLLNGFTSRLISAHPSSSYTQEWTAYRKDVLSA
ncbi:Tat pathway signal protein [Streptomyces albireticuli]|uniref:Tat pathway signal protein n=2 Tax=Streptomyces albireticuli TaxID=1940 RepID=A0A2A2D8Z3_9ACTN|nr:Tat pathway signal protein [Streptomyces albireticuli]